jgi:hypothetical protein
MSLTIFLDKTDVRAKFSQEFTKPRFRLERAILAPPVTKNYGLVGTAFDYLMRFYLKHINPQSITGAWIAESAVDKMKEQGMAIAATPIGRVQVKIPRKMPEFAENIVFIAKKHYSEYISSGKINEDLVKSAIQLAQLDTYFRTGIIDKLGGADKGDIDDLKRLISIVDVETWKTGGICILNPTFGVGSVLVGGADADLILDNTLIDIKTKAKLEFGRGDLNQLIGYYILYRIGGIDDVPSVPKIDSLAIYFARYAFLLSIPVKEVVSEAKLPIFIKWFTERASVQ